MAPRPNSKPKRSFFGRIKKRDATKSHVLAFKGGADRHQFSASYRWRACKRRLWRLAAAPRLICCLVRHSHHCRPSLATAATATNPHLAQQWLTYFDKALSCWLPHSIRYFIISASFHVYIAQWSRAIGELELGQEARVVVQLTCDRPLAVSSQSSHASYLVALATALNLPSPPPPTS